MTALVNVKVPPIPERVTESPPTGGTGGSVLKYFALFELVPQLPLASQAWTMYSTLIPIAARPPVQRKELGEKTLNDLAQIGYQERRLPKNRYEAVRMNMRPSQ